jgi:DNA-binding transcriptional LysR family regulator
MTRTPHAWINEYKSAPPIHTRALKELPHSHISLKQWNTLLAVVRCGSFARAAEVLHISQPAISYTIAKIEERLGISILRPEGRRARITEIGRQLLAHVEPLVQQAVEVEAVAERLRKDWRPEIRLAVVNDFPSKLLLSAILDYSGKQPCATVLLTETADERIRQLLQDRAADLAITRRLCSGMQGDILIEIEYVPVAHAAHPLFALDRPLTDADLQQAVEVTFNGADTAAGGKHTGGKRWNVSNLDTAEKALMEGIGYGWLPWHQVQAALAEGRLAVLPISVDRPPLARFYLAHHASATPGNEIIRLVDTLRKIIGATSASA